MNKDELVDAVEKLGTDEIADLVEDLPPDVVAEVQEGLSTKRESTAAGGNELPGRFRGCPYGLRYCLNSARCYARCRSSLFTPFKETPDHTDQVFVVDRDERLMGTLPVDRILTHAPDQLVKNVMVADVLTLSPLEDVGDAASFRLRTL